MDDQLRDNISALEARPMLRHNFVSRSIKGVEPEFKKLRAQFHYHGPVDVRIPGCAPFSMHCEADDNVAQTFFYYGDGSYESLSLIVFALLARRTNHVLDIGAHTGVFSLAAAKSNPRSHMHYFDIRSPVLQRAQMNAQISGVSQRISFNHVGLSSSSGEMESHFDTRNPMWTGASLEAIPARTRLSGAAVEVVPTTTLDAYWESQGKPAVGLAKIDVENHELSVFAGGSNLLSAQTPSLLCEVLSLQQFGDFQDALVKYGYQVFYEIDDEALTMREVLPGLTYADGTKYSFEKYHNILACKNQFSSPFFHQVSALLADSPLGQSKLNVLV